LKHGSFPPSLPEAEDFPAEETDIVRGILKIPASVVASALNQPQTPPSSHSAFKSALKKDSSFEEKSLSPARSILKSGGKSEEWTASESSSEEENNSAGIKENLASILNDVATQATKMSSPALTVEEKNTLSSDTECDTSSSGGREVKKIISNAMDYRSVRYFFIYLLGTSPNCETNFYLIKTHTFNLFLWQRIKEKILFRIKGDIE